MAFAVTGIIAAGVGVQIYGDIQSANDQASLDNARASVAEQQAAELAKRNQANATLIEQEAYRQKLQFGASYAASGKAGVGIGSQLQIQNQADQQNMINTKEALFQENMLLQQSGIDRSLASETESAGVLQAVGAGLLGAGAAAKGLTAGGKNPGYGPPGQGMGSYPSVDSNPYFSASSPPALGAGAYGGG